MPELHKNQIQWEAPEAQKVTLAKPDYTPLAESMSYLSRVADDISQRQAKIDDDKLVADLAYAEDRANKMIDDADSATADYEQLSEKALSEIQSAFYNYDEPARVRFTRTHKDYMDSVQLAIADKIQKKRASQLENDVDINIPMWTTEALNRGEKGLQWMLDEKIAKTLAGISSPEVIAKKQFTARHYYDEAVVNNGLNGNEKTIKETMTRLKNNKDLTSLNAYERSVMYARGKSTLESLEKAKKSGDDPNLKLIEEMYAGYAMVQDGNDMEQLYNDIIGQGSGLVVVGYEQDKNGNLQPKYIDMNQYTPAQRLAFATKVSNAYDKYNADLKVRQDNYNNDITKMLIEYKRTKANKSAGVDSALVAMAKARQDVAHFSRLDEGTRKEIDNLLANEHNARVEALNGTMYYIDSFAWSAKRRSNPMGVLIDRIQSGTQPTRKKTTAEELLGKTVEGEYRGDGGLLQNIIQMYKNDYYKDMKRDSLSEYALVSAVVVKAFRDAGRLEGTRLSQSDGSYVDALITEIDSLRQNGTYNTLITNENAKTVQDMFKLIVRGDLTENEQKLVNEMEQWSKTAQASRDLAPAIRYLSRPEPDTDDVNMKLNGAYLQPAQDALEVITKMGPVSSKIDKARKGEQ